MANGIWEGMKQAPGLFFGGMNNPGLSSEQNQQAQRQAMLMAGLQGLMASRSAPGQAAPGTLQILAQMGMTGQQAGQGIRQQMTQQQALQDPSLGLSPQQQAMLQALPPEAQQQVLAQLATAGPPQPQVVGEGASLVGPGGQEIFRNEGGGQDISSNLTDALFLLGHDEESLKALSPQEQVQVRQQAHALMQRMKTPLVNVSNPPSPPPGYRYVRDANGEISHLEPIPGGPVDRADRVRDRTVARQAFTVTDDVDRALDLVDRYGRAASGIGGVSSFLPETPANILNHHIESIKGNIGVDQLLQIKQQGAGLGQVPQRQLEMLAGMLGRISATMPPEVLKYNLRRIGEIYQSILDETLVSGTNEDLRLLFGQDFSQPRGQDGGGDDPYADLIPEGN